MPRQRARRRWRGAGDPRITSPRMGMRCLRRAMRPQNLRALDARRSRAARSANISQEARPASLPLFSRSSWPRSLVRSHSRSCSSPRSPGGAARHAGRSACSARSQTAALSVAAPVADPWWAGDLCVAGCGAVGRVCKIRALPIYVGRSAARPRTQAQATGLGRRRPAVRRASAAGSHG